MRGFGIIKRIDLIEKARIAILIGIGFALLERSLKIDPDELGPEGGIEGWRIDKRNPIMLTSLIGCLLT
jgi:hypothetical protein